MKKTNLDNIIENLKTITAIAPSNNWNVAFENKLHSSKYKTSYTFNFFSMLIILAFMNVFLIINYNIDGNSKISTERIQELETLSKQLSVFCK